MAKIKSKNLVLVIVALFICAVLSIAMTMQLRASAAGDTDDASASFAKAAEAAARYFNRSQSGEGPTAPTVSSTSAGGLVGYVTPETGDHTVGQVGEAHNITVYTRQSLDNAGDEYVEYLDNGYKIANAGIDEVAESDAGTTTRMLSGSLVMFLYLMSIGVDAFFSVVLSILSAANPFLLIEKGAAALAKNMQSTIPALSRIADYMNSLFVSVRKLGMGAVLPIFFATTIAGILLFRKSGDSAFNKVRKLFMRLAFLFFGLPILGGAYTAVIQSCQANMKESKPVINLIASNFVDFESWSVDRSFLNIEKVDENNERKTAKEINQVTTGGLASFILGSSFDDATDYDSSTSSDVTAIGVRWCTDIIKRYSTGKKISAGEYASKVYASLGTTIDVKLMFVNSSKPESFYITPEPEVVPYYNKDGQNINNITAENLATFNATRFTNEKPNGVTNIWAATYAGTQSSLIDRLFGNISGSGNKLSMMATYNYLNSEFTEDAINVFSTSESNSSRSRKSHYSVNMVGTGARKILYFCNLVVLLACYSVLGYGYGLGLLFANLKALYKVVPSVLTGFVGSLKGIVTTIVYAIALIFEVIVTIVLYVIARDMISLIFDVITAVFDAINLKLDNSFGTVAHLVMSPIVILLTIILTVIIIKKLLEWRKALVVAVTQEATVIVNKFIGGRDVEVAAPNLEAKSGSFGQRALSAASVGSGLIMAASGTSLGEKLGLSPAAHSSHSTTGNSSSGFVRDTNSSSSSYFDGGSVDGSGTVIENGGSTIDGYTGYDQTDVEGGTYYGGEQSSENSSYGGDSDNSSSVASNDTTKAEEYVAKSDFLEQLDASDEAIDAKNMVNQAEFNSQADTFSDLVNHGVDYFTAGSDEERATAAEAIKGDITQMGDVHSDANYARAQIAEGDSYDSSAEDNRGYNTNTAGDTDNSQHSSGSQEEYARYNSSNEASSNATMNEKLAYNDASVRNTDNYQPVTPDGKTQTASAAMPVKSGFNSRNGNMDGNAPSGATYRGTASSNKVSSEKTSPGKTSSGNVPRSGMNNVNEKGGSYIINTGKPVVDNGSGFTRGNGGRTAGSSRINNEYVQKTAGVQKINEKTVNETTVNNINSRRTVEDIRTKAYGVKIAADGLRRQSDDDENK